MFDRDWLVVFLDPIIFALEEFYPKLMQDWFDDYTHDLIVNIWYGYSVDYWYYLAD